MMPLTNPTIILCPQAQAAFTRLPKMLPIAPRAAPTWDGRVANQATMDVMMDLTQAMALVARFANQAPRAESREAMAESTRPGNCANQAIMPLTRSGIIECPTRAL